MHNPKLKRRLHRAAMPALFVRGESDGLVSAKYLAAYAKLLPKARTVTIPAAGKKKKQSKRPMNTKSRTNLRGRPAGGGGRGGGRGAQKGARGKSGAKRRPSPRKGTK